MDQLPNYEFIWSSPYIIGVWVHAAGRAVPLMLNHLSGRPDDVFFLTPERIAQGGLDLTLSANGHPLHADAEAATVLAKLISRGALDQHHAFYASVFRDLRRAFRMRTDYKSNSIYAAEFFGADTSNGIFETVYLRVCRRIMGRRERLIVFACDSAPTDDNMQAIGLAWHDCREAFDILIEAIDEGREWAEEERKLTPKQRWERQERAYAAFQKFLRERQARATP